MSWDVNVDRLLLHRVLVEFWTYNSTVHNRHGPVACSEFQFAKNVPSIPTSAQSQTHRRRGAPVREVSGRLPRPTAQGSKPWETRNLAPAWRRLQATVWIRLSLLFPVCPSNRGRPGGLWGVHDNTGAKTSLFWQSGRLPGQHHWQHLLAGQRCQRSLPRVSTSSRTHLLFSCVPSQTRNVPFFCFEGNENTWEWWECVFFNPCVLGFRYVWSNNTWEQ